MALSQFSPVEKESIYQIVCNTMLVDKVKDSREQQLVEEIADIIGINQEEREASKQLDETTVIETIRNMTNLQKQRAYVAKFIAQMVLADGKVDDQERLYFNTLLDKLYLPIG